MKHLCLLLLLLLHSTAAADDRPNILFIFTDDHAPHAIGAYGGWLQDIDPTPNIDQLAAEGMLFQNSFCTNSICGPSRAVILTGKHSHLKWLHEQRQSTSTATSRPFPKLLATGRLSDRLLIGKWHLSSDPQGFDHWKVLPGQGDYYNPDFHHARRACRPSKATAPTWSPTWRSTGSNSRREG